MTEQLPTPIEPQDIRVGDVVRIQFDKGAQEGVVKVTAPDHILINYNMARYVAHGFTDGSWFLISRPTPPREPGTLWRLKDPESLWVKVSTTSDIEDADYRQVSGVFLCEGWLGERDTDDASIIGRLTPVEPPEVAEMRRRLAAGIRAFIPDTCTTINDDAWCDRCGPYRRVLAIVEPQP